MAPHKPTGYPTVSPYLIAASAAKTIDFAVKTFGAVELRRFPGESGKVRHAELRIDDSVVMIADGLPPDWPPVPGHLHIYVPDVEAAYRRALDAGATSLQAPVKKDDDDKRGGVLDPGGITWWISTKVA